MLKDDLPELLMPPGDIEKFAAALARVQRCDLTDYEQLCRRSVESAARFNWSTIAEKTAASYQAHLLAGP